MIEKRRSFLWFIRNIHLFKPFSNPETKYISIPDSIKSTHTEIKILYCCKNQQNSEKSNNNIYYFILLLFIIAIYRKNNFDKDINKLENSASKKDSILIDLFIAPDRAADMQANLTEIFPLWVERHGLAAAHRIRKVQIARLIIGEYWNKVIELIKAVKIAGS